MPSVGVGYQFTDNLRGDVTLGYSKQSFDDLDVDVRSWDMMANAYVDLGNYYGFTPYLGAGLGFANVRYSIDTAYGNYKTDDDYRLAWALMAGVGIDVASTSSLISAIVMGSSRVLILQVLQASRSATRIFSPISCAPVCASRPGNTKSH